nr:helix-turn-helix domain-containing protein [uncultured Cohaesibacter sp.]
MGHQFSTHDIQQNERFDYWHEIVYRTYAPCSGHVKSYQKFDANLKTHGFGSLEVSDVRSTAIQYERKPFDVRTGPRDDIFFSLMLEGETKFEQSGQQFIQKAGDILLYDSGRAYSYNYEAQYRSILMKVPRVLLETRSLDTDKMAGVLLAGDSAHGRLVGSLISQSHQIVSNLDADNVGEFSPSMLDMICVALEQSMRDELLGKSQNGKLEQIKLYLRDNLANTDLTLDSIAKEQNVSIRTLSRLFAGSGTTPMGWLQSLRLQFAYKALAEQKARNVTEVALDYGFKDLSHFGRSFKKEFGITPKSLLTKTMN